MLLNFLLKKLKGISDPEKNEKIIGNLFIKVFKKKQKKYNNIKYLAQGKFIQILLKADLVLVCKTSKIKSHHNVGNLPKINEN